MQRNWLSMVKAKEVEATKQVHAPPQPAAAPALNPQSTVQYAPLRKTLPQ